MTSQEFGMKGKYIVLAYLIFFVLLIVWLASLASFWKPFFYFNALMSIIIVGKILFEFWRDDEEFEFNLREWAIFLFWLTVVGIVWPVGAYLIIKDLGDI